MVYNLQNAAKAIGKKKKKRNVVIPVKILYLQINFKFVSVYKGSA
jgi:hypothetical protein